MRDKTGPAKEARSFGDHVIEQQDGRKASGVAPGE